VNLLLQANNRLPWFLASRLYQQRGIYHLFWDEKSHAVTVDPTTGRVYVADQGNNRVLRC